MRHRNELEKLGFSARLLDESERILNKVEESAVHAQESIIIKEPMTQAAQVFFIDVRKKSDTRFMLF